MINITKLKLFPFFVRQVSVPTNDAKQYNLIFMSENEDFVSVYKRLNIRRQFAKAITVVPFKIPRLMVNAQMLMPYKKATGLIPVTKGGTNTFIDTTPFFQLLDSKYGKSNYNRNIIMSKVVPYFSEVRRFGENHNVLIYHVNLSKTVAEKFLMRRSVILALMAKSGDGTLPFDSVVLAIEKGGTIKYTSIYSKDMKPLSTNKVISVLKSLSPSNKDIEDTETEDTEEEIIKPKVDPTEKNSILNAIAKYQKTKFLTS